MRCSPRFSVALALAFGVLGSMSVQAQNKLTAKWTNKIEADPSKSYTLDKANGPWMVMVASFHPVGDKVDQSEGTSPAEAAQALVLELRQKKIPAYVYSVKAKNESVKSQDSLGRSTRMKNLRVVDSVCVLAGNYKSIDEAKAQETLKFIKQYNPKAFETGVNFVVSPGRPGPLSKAFLTSNPLLSNDEMEAMKQATDPLLISLNNNEQFSLYENTGKYTLMVAKFSGKSVNVVNESMEKAESYFTKGGNDLDQAAISARNLVKALRSREPVTTDPDFKDYCRLDAYIWHDHTSSIVTVGSFESAQDPQIRKYVELFGPKVKVSESGQKTPDYRYLPVPQEEGGFNVIPFDPSLPMIAVPHVRKN